MLKSLEESPPGIYDLIALAVGLVLLAGVGRAVFRARRQANYLKCGSCGYSRNMLPHDRDCPECGASMADVPPVLKPLKHLKLAP